VVRAKTGTLSGVATLAGLVHTKSGHLFAFAFLADSVPSTYDADRALDALAARLASCGC
jgi:D-alanyl-D-alanine carboxypeptidase/D-alanyl-D-alanine-endopeptidase (penicillin-binding protein 4)